MPQFGGASEKCSVCSKTVYLAEKIVVEDKEDKKTFHKTCLKCTHCNSTLSLGNYASMNGVMYCKPHFKQLFATKGNYNEGFGKEKLTSKWAPSSTAAAPAGNSFVPVDKVEEAKPAEKKDTPSSIASRFQKSSLNSDKCEKCSKTVYATEKIVIEEKEGKKVFHKACLRCTHCQVVLTLGNYASMGGVTYCKPHLKQLFATKGNYDEGFGKEKHTTKWEPTANTAPTTFVPVEKAEVPKENKNTSDVANKFKNISASNACDKCGKTVYLTEKVVVEDKDDKKLYHKSCLRCTHCQVVLSLGNYASMGGVTYCKPHFKQLFASKGNYDEGFGKEKHTTKWIDKDEGEAREESHHEEPRHEAPRKEEPRKEEPRHEEPHHEEPKHEEPKHEEPRHEEPRHEEPKHEDHHDHSHDHHDHDHDHSHDHHDHDHSHDHHDHDHSHDHSHDHHDHDHDHEHGHDHGNDHEHERREEEQEADN